MRTRTYVATSTDEMFAKGLGILVIGSEESPFAAYFAYLYDGAVVTSGIKTQDEADEILRYWRASDVLKITED